jgi:citrate lyase subunit beta/citryl-CoA lyase
MEKAAAGPADIVLLDLEDSVAENEKPKARSMVLAFLKEHAAACARFWVRINPIEGPHAIADLAAIMPGAPGGIMLPKSRGRGDLDRLGDLLGAHEAAGGAPAGTTRVLVLATETAAGVFTTNSYVGAPRLAAMSWGAEDLAADIGAISNRNDDGGYAFTYELSRSLCLLGATAAGVPAIETIEGDFRNEALLRKRAVAARRDGFRGMLAIHPAQVEIINAAFSPSTEEIAAAREIVDLFEKNPGAGTIGHKGAMLDRPHLARARAVLALAGRR